MNKPVFGRVCSLWVTRIGSCARPVVVFARCERAAALDAPPLALVPGLRPFERPVVDDRRELGVRQLRVSWPRQALPPAPAPQPQRQRRLRLMNPVDAAALGPVLDALEVDSSGK